MPGYPHLARTEIDPSNIADHLRTLKIVGVPYDDAMIENARADLIAQATPDAELTGLVARYPKAATGDLDSNPAAVTEMDALVAYLQVLGRMVDFTTFRPEYTQTSAAGGQ